MTHTIPVGSLKTDRAIKFGRALSAAMKRRGVGSRTIAEPLGASRTSVMYWRTGRILPRTETVRKLAEVLASPSLVDLAMELRKKACLVCGTEFVDDSGSDNRRYCSVSCQKVKEKSVVGSDRRQRAAVAERRLLAHQRAVAAFCGACEPSGRCVTPECELRPVSPLPLFEERFDMPLATPKPHNGYRDPVADSARQSRIWANLSPEQRQARIDRAAEASRVARGLVPA